LYDTSGRPLDTAQLGAIEGVRFIQRAARAPFVEVVDRSGGTGVRARSLTWYSVDRARLEPVLELTLELNRWSAMEDRGPVTGQVEHEDSVLRVEPTPGAVFQNGPWPALHVRTTRRVWGLGARGKVLQRGVARVHETSYEFDPRRRRYRPVQARGPTARARCRRHVARSSPG
jgi:hypothetical protein